MKEVLNFYKDFPKEGILFIDLIPFLQNKEVFSEIIAKVAEATSAPNIATPEARGFLFAAPLLTTDNKVESVIPIRKRGKLPYNEGDLCDVEIIKEYGADHLFYRKSDIAACKADNGEIHITILDDVLATGGTAEGVVQSLLKQEIIKDGKPMRIVIDEFIFIVEIDELKGAERLEKIAPVKSLIHL
jgi:adenine phosphoribosyltransferase